MALWPLSASLVRFDQEKGANPEAGYHDLGGDSALESLSPHSGGVRPHYHARGARAAPGLEGKKIIVPGHLILAIFFFKAV